MFLYDLEIESPFLHENVYVHWVGEVDEARHRTVTHHLNRVLPAVQEGLELEFSVIISFSHTFQTWASKRRLSALVLNFFPLVTHLLASSPDLRAGTLQPHWKMACLSKWFLLETCALELCLPMQSCFLLCHYSCKLGWAEDS